MGHLAADTQVQAIDRKDTDMTEATDNEEEKYAGNHIDTEQQETGPNGTWTEKKEPEIHAQPGTKDHERRLEKVKSILDDDKGDVKKPSTLIHQIFDRDSSVPKKVHNDEYTRLNEVDKDWKYNITLGDLELRKITHYDGTEETLRFPMEEYPDDYKPDGDDDNKGG